MEDAAEAPAPATAPAGVMEAVQAEPHLPAAVAPAQLREDMIQNALSFLGHPKVRSAPDDSKRSFLEKKGLTEAEITEAFRRVPAAPAQPVASVANPGVPAAPPPKPYPTATVEAIQPLQIVPAQQQAVGQPIRWTQVAIGVGFIAATAYTLHHYLLPHLLNWLKPAGSADKASEDKRIGEAVAAVIQKQTEEVGALVEVAKQLLTRLDEQQKREEKGKNVAPEGRLSLQDLRQELRTFATTLQGATTSGRGQSGVEELADLKQIKDELKRALAEHAASLPSLRVPYGNGLGNGSLENSTGSSPNGRMAVPIYSSAPPPFAADGAPSAARIYSSAPPPYSAPAAPDPRGRGPGGGGGSSDPGSGWTLPQGVNGADDGAPAPPPHPASYMEVLEMLEKGVTPSNVRTDIVDTPPNPEQPPPESRLKPRAKPWLRANGASESPSPAGGAYGALGAGGTGPSPGAAPSSLGVAVQDAGGPAGSSSPPGWRPPAVPRPSLPAQTLDRSRSNPYRDNVSDTGSAASTTSSHPGSIGTSVAA